MAQAPALAVLTACLLVATVAPFHAPLIGWLAFAPLLLALRRASAVGALGLGALAGGVLFAGTGYGVAGYDAALAAALPFVGAGIFAVWAFAAQRALAHESRAIRVAGPALLWAALECVIVLPAFSLPATPGIGLVDSPALGVAALFGVHALSFAMVLSAAAIVEAAPALTAGPSRRRGAAALAALAPALLSGIAGSLALRSTAESAQRFVSYHAVQPSIPFERAAESWWVPAYRRAIHDRFAAALDAAAGTPADLFLWPEGGAMLGDLASGAALGAPRVAGPRVHLVNAIDLAPDGRRRNRIFALAEGMAPQIYEKRRLVPIAERGYRRGESQPVFDTGAARIGSLVCFEVCFSDAAREQVAHGAELLFASTNDGAFGNTALVFLHRDHARVRAVETGRPVLFVSNDGPSAEIDPRGRIGRALALGRRDVLDGRVALGSGATLHQRIAPAIAPAFWIAALAILFATRRRTRAPLRIPRRSWIGGIVLAFVAAALLMAASAASVRSAVDAGGAAAPDALSLPPATAIAEAVGPAGESPVRALSYLASSLGTPHEAGEIAARLAGAAADLPALAAAARALGFEASVDAFDYETIRSLLPPFVASLAGPRWIVVMEVSRDAVRAFDPARGFVELARERFERAWGGEVVTIRPSPAGVPPGVRVGPGAYTAHQEGAQ